MKAFSSLFLALFASTAPAFAITVSSPANGAEVTSPLTISAAAATCSSQNVSAMGYSFDNSPNTTIVNGSKVAATIPVATGSHVLHVKAWGPKGASCVENVSLNVVTPPASYSVATQSVQVNSPASAATVTSPFPLSAVAPTCSLQTVSAMGYSLDNSASTTIVNGSSIAANVSSATGPHTLHVKAWGNHGGACVTDVTLNVTAPVSGPVVPAGAVSVSSIQSMTNWQAEYDTASGVGGSSASGVMSMVSTPSMTGGARKFTTTFSDYGGERYHVTFGDDTSAMNFLYDTWVYVDSSVNQVANIEMDMNQTMPNGQTAIFGFQCDGWTSTWDYTANAGTPEAWKDVWLHSKQSCNPHTWAVNAWHHVQVTYSRDDSGNITYRSVWLDGVEQDLNVTVNSAFALGWGPSLLTNLQVDGYLPGTASPTVYLDNLTITRW